MSQLHDKVGQNSVDIDIYKRFSYVGCFFKHTGRCLILTE